MERTEITALYVRMAMQSAAGSGLKFPSPEFEEYVAAYLTKLKIT
jgi:hypothetical protein